MTRTRHGGPVMHRGSATMFARLIDCSHCRCPVHGSRVTSPASTPPPPARRRLRSPMRPRHRWMRSPRRKHGSRPVAAEHRRSSGPNRARPSAGSGSSTPVAMRPRRCSAIVPAARARMRGVSTCRRSGRRVPRPAHARRHRRHQRGRSSRTHRAARSPNRRTGACGSRSNWRRSMHGCATDTRRARRRVSGSAGGMQRQSFVLRTADRRTHH